MVSIIDCRFSLEEKSLKMNGCSTVVDEPFGTCVALNTKPNAGQNDTGHDGKFCEMVAKGTACLNRERCVKSRADNSLQYMQVCMCQFFFVSRLCKLSADEEKFFTANSALQARMGRWSYYSPEG